MKKKKVVAIGGGTGTVAVLSGLKDYNNIELSVIVNMTDDGGSNRVIRDEFGLLPLSDLRKSIIALSGKGNMLLRELFTYRFDKGKGFSGHTLGNIIMTALSDISGSELKALESVCSLFDVVGEIIPVTLENADLVAEYEKGGVVCGEHLIDEPRKQMKERIKRLYTKPKVKSYSKARGAIKEADFIVIGPGDLYTSILASIVIDGVSQAISSCDARIIYVSNLMTKNGQTRGMGISDLVSEVAKYIKRQPEFVVVNNTKIPGKILKKYWELEKELPIKDDLKDNRFYKIVRGNIISSREVKRVKGDPLKRSLVRHDAKKLGRVLYELIAHSSKLKSFSRLRKITWT